MKNKKNTTILLFIVMLSFLPLALKAQGPGFGGGDTPDTPIDGGISVLAIAGVTYGAKKIREMKKKKMMMDAEGSEENGNK